MLRISVVIPTFNGQSVIAETLASLAKQTLLPDEILVSDDASTDATLSIVSSFDRTLPIRTITSAANRGYPGNIRRAYANANADLIILLGQDDILAPCAIELLAAPFSNEGVTAVTRPYFWFESHIARVARVKKRLPNQETTELLDLTSDPRLIAEMFATTDQLSGLALRKSAVKLDFSDDIFPCHVYPFGSALANGTVAMIPDFVVAVRIESSQSRGVSSVYRDSPAKTWLDWIDAMESIGFPRKVCDALSCRLVGSNVVGLAQIRNYSDHPRRFLLREVAVMIGARCSVLLTPSLLLVSLALFLLPTQVTRRLTEVVKRYTLIRIRDKEGLLEAFLSSTQPRDVT